MPLPLIDRAVHSSGGALDAMVDAQKTRQFFSESENTEFVALPGFGHVFSSHGGDDVIAQAAPLITRFLGFPPGAGKQKARKAQVAPLESTS